MTERDRLPPLPRVDTPDGRPPEAQPQWRKDFPIDWPEDHYVARRDFTKFLVLTSLAMVVGQFWIVVQNIFRRTRGAPPVYKIANLADVPIGGALPFTYPGPHDPCLLLRPNPDTLIAFDQKCTHLSCAVVPDLAHGRLRCPCHHGYFDATTGRPLAGPPRRPLPRVLLTVQDGVVYATGIAEGTA
jgi:nitrite reductase/ring-hydroxylating ferredoxin subunit